MVQLQIILEVLRQEVHLVEVQVHELMVETLHHQVNQEQAEMVILILLVDQQ